MRKIDRRSFLKAAALSAAALGLAACGADQTAASSQPASSQAAAAAAEYPWDFAKKTTDIDELKVECSEQGTLAQLDYETRLYASDPEQAVTKRLYVYLPYGYDASQPYNILYLMHGGGENEEYWLAGERWGPTTRNVLDNMIQQGLCDPFIVVTPTFYPPEAGAASGEAAGSEAAASEAASSEAAASTAAASEAASSEAAASTAAGEAAMSEEEAAAAASDLTYVFAEELRNDVIPAVESQYLTYASGDMSIESLAASREHRAFAGFSMGSMTSIHAVLMQNLDLFGWVGSYSGAKTTLEEFQTALESEAYKDLPILFWYNGNGKGDIAHDEHDAFCHSALEAMPGRFTDGENFAWVDFRDGTHSYAAWLADLYNSMLVFFK